MTTLIKNVVLIDGTGKPPFKADVLFKDNKISAIGHFPRYGADELIDGMEAFLAPGFIDPASSIDRRLSVFGEEVKPEIALNGITTVIAGHSGLSLAPLLYGSLEALKGYSGVEKLNVNWHTVADFFNVLSRRKLGVNFGTLVGETTMTLDITGKKHRPLSDNEMHIFMLLVARSLAQGALGVSIGPLYGVEYRLSDARIAALVRLLQKHNAPLVCDLGYDDTAEQNTSESVRKALSARAARIVTLGKKVQEKDSESYFIVSFDAPQATPGAAFLPSWLRGKEEDEILIALKSNSTRTRILKEIIKEKKSDMIVSRAPGNEYLEGKTVKAFAENRNIAIGDGFLTLLTMTNLRIAFSAQDKPFSSVQGKSISSVQGKPISFVQGKPKSDTEDEAMNPHALIASPTARFLEMIEKEARMPIEKGIQKITSLPAFVFGIEGRGVIREGYYADMVLFKDARIRTVFVNGKAAVKNGELQTSLAGKPILKSAVK